MFRDWKDLFLPVSKVPYWRIKLISYLKKLGVGYQLADDHEGMNQLETVSVLRAVNQKLQNINAPGFLFLSPPWFIVWNSRIHNHNTLQQQVLGLYSRLKEREDEKKWLCHFPFAFWGALFGKFILWLSVISFCILCP